MSVLAHIDKLKDFLEYWNTLHISLENAVAQCPDWVQDTHNALNKALEDAQGEPSAEAITAKRKAEKAKKDEESKKAAEEAAKAEEPAEGESADAETAEA